MKKFVFWGMMRVGVVGVERCDKDDEEGLEVWGKVEEGFDRG